MFIVNFNMALPLIEHIYQWNITTSRTKESELIFGEASCFCLFFQLVLIWVFWDRLPSRHLLDFTISCEIYLKSTKTTERPHCCRSVLLFINFEQIPQLFIVILLLLWTSKYWLVRCWLGFITAKHVNSFTCNIFAKVCNYSFFVAKLDLLSFKLKWKMYTFSI